MTGLGTFGLTIPNFVVAPVLQIVFGLTLAWLPVGGWNDGSPRNLDPAGDHARPAADRRRRAHDPRRDDRDPALEPHPHPALARPADRASIVRHALRGAALPVVSYLGPAAAALLTGSVVVETIFGLPGIGRYFVEGALNRDYTLVMGTVVVVAVFVLLFNLIVDILYAVHRSARPLRLRRAMAEGAVVPADPHRQPVVGRSLWADARGRLFAQPGRGGEHDRARRSSPLACIFGPLLTGHPFDQVYPDYVRVPASLDAYPKADADRAGRSSASPPACAPRPRTIDDRRATASASTLVEPRARSTSGFSPISSAPTCSAPPQVVERAGRGPPARRRACPSSASISCSAPTPTAATS